jgi:hypothetical protein
MSLVQSTALRLPADVLDRLRQFARRLSYERNVDISWAQVARQLLEDALDAKEESGAVDGGEATA